MKLLIISHTEHYNTDTGRIVGWSPTVNEINHLAPQVTSITHVAMLHSGKPPKSVLAYAHPNIHFVALPALGGKGLKHKLKLLYHLPKVLKIVRKELKHVDAFQLRTPTGIGVFLIPYLTLCSGKKGWYKYAGNWNQVSPPLGYRLQRWMLKHQSRTVTINGTWPNQPKHCVTFENPCLTEADLSEGKTVVLQKQLDHTLHFCYVGRIETPKGVGRIIEAFKSLSPDAKDRVGVVHLVGDGQEKARFQDLAKDAGVVFQFHGYLGRKEVFDMYKTCHFFLMPTTASEGFPKVIAEAANFGCVPVVSSVSAIAHYIKHQQNGLLVNPISAQGLKAQLQVICNMENRDYQYIIKQSQDMVKAFTFAHYNKRILNNILH